MHGIEYQKLAGRTEAPVTEAVLARLTANPRLIHALIGLTTEAGEINDQLKKHVFYGKELDIANILEEVGDLMWYVALVCNATETDMDTVMKANIAKLKKRFAEKFSEDEALNRDLNKERDTLEKNLAEAPEVESPDFEPDITLEDMANDDIPPDADEEDDIIDVESLADEIRTLPPSEVEAPKPPVIIMPRGPVGPRPPIKEPEPPVDPMAETQEISP